RTRAAPTPTNISTKLEPATEKNGTSASPATARASSVLPVPGGPTMSAPRGTWAPAREYRPGVRRKSTTSLISDLAPSYPATSANVVEGRSSSNTFARDRPAPSTPWNCPAAPRDSRNQKNTGSAMKSRMRSQDTSWDPNPGDDVDAVVCTPERC